MKQFTEEQILKLKQLAAYLWLEEETESNYLDAVTMGNGDYTFDIGHTQGEASVAQMVLEWIDGV